MSVPYACSCSSSPAVVALDGGAAEQRVVLRENLRLHGWSPVVVPVSLRSENAPSPQTIRALLEDARKNGARKHLTYRTAESGAATNDEPKESLELATRDAGECGDSDVSRWCRALREAARVVCETLGLTAVLDANDATCMDLLRVFGYHGVAEESLGSSPHTDWGSLTVVWQDQVGGLETYCRACRTWTRVDPICATDATLKAAEESNNDDSVTMLPCIVHVGDVTSLAMGSKRYWGEENGEDRLPPAWPSPRHRVVSPVLNEAPADDTPQILRTSLVYFCYPPEHMSIEDMRREIRQEENPTLPPDDYYLLHDQSVIKGSVPTPREKLQQLLNMPLGGVFRSKWGQVQR